MAEVDSTAALQDAVRKAYIAYLKIKVEEEDWHGVSDAANDLRVLDAKRT